MTGRAGASAVADLPAIDAGSIEALITKFAAVSEPGRGVTRLGYTTLEREAHAVFARTMTELGLQVWTDHAGNTIAELTGRDPGAPAIGTGSHLDSVPQAGRFDGIAGVCAAIEAARAVVASTWRPTARLRFVVFATEEGARFGQACTGSRAVAGLMTRSDLETLRDAEGVTMAEAMNAVGLDATRLDEARWRSEDWVAFIELHIEQGTVLEASAVPIGVVDAISGSTRLTVQLEGVASHTGGTPMHQRHDAMVAAAECVLACEQVANDATHHGTRVTVGKLDVLPGSITTIPGQVSFSVDIRDFDSARQRLTAEDLDDRFGQICTERGVGITSTVIGDTSPVILPVDIVDTIAKATAQQGLTYRLLSSGASHDAQQVSKITPTGMIFVPSIGGLSHVPEEDTSFADIARGTDVLLATIATIDADYAARLRA